MNWLAELMPLFVLRWFAHLYIQRETCGEKVVMYVRPGVFIELKDTKCPLCKRQMDGRHFQEGK